MKIGNPFGHPIQLHDRPTDEIEQRFVGLRLADQSVQHLGHKQRNGALADVERQARKRRQAAHLLHAMHPRLRLLDPFEFDQEHRLEQRRLVAPPPAAVHALDHVIHPPEQVGKQVGDHRTVAVFDRMQHHAAGFVRTHYFAPERNAANFSTARPR